MQKDKIFKTILLFCIPLLVLSCSKTAGDDSPGQDANLALALITRSENGDLAITGEDRFTSLAVYIFNNDNGDLEFSELITDFTPESSASLYTKSVRVTQDKKAVYAIANYAGQSFTAAGQPVTITEQTPRSVLDALQVASATFAGNDIVMVGKKVVEMTGTAVNASIEMERLVGRLDLHVYKAAELTDDAVELVGDHKIAGPLRGGKTSMFDGGTRIPFMLRWPAAVKPQVSDAFVCQMDLLASFAALLGQSYPDKLDSENTLDTFLGKSKKGREELVIEGMFNYAYRQGDWALIPPYYNPYSKEDGDFIGLGYGYKLYNLKKDIGQQENVATKYPKKLGELINRFEYLKSTTNKVTRY